MPVGSSKCMICGNAATIELDSEFRIIECELCGKFGIHTSLLSGPDSVHGTEDELEKWSHLLVERRLKSDDRFIVFWANDTRVEGKNFFVKRDEFLATYPKDALEHYNRALLNLSRMFPTPTTLGASNHLLTNPLLFARRNNVVTMLQLFENDGLVKFLNGSSFHFYMTSKGWSRVDQLKSPKNDSRQAFVAIWFTPEHDKLFDDAIKPAIEADGITRAIKVDRTEHNEKIDDKIIAEIRRSRFLVADLTGHNSGVYFEAGFALGLGLPVIWCVSKAEKSTAHFDTRQYNQIRYSDAADLREKLINRIRATNV